MKLFCTALLLVTLCVPAAPCAAEILVFRDGRTMKVSRFFFVGDRMSVELPGGGKMEFAADVVEYIAPDEITPEEEDAREIRVGGIQVAENRQGAAGGPVDQAKAEKTASTEAPWMDDAYRDLVVKISREQSIDLELLAAVIKVESNFNAKAVSKKGAKGLMQLMADTARRYRVRDVFDPEQNLEGGARYLKELLEAFGGDTRLALAAYNAGPDVVRKYKDVPPYPETRRYVERVFSLYSPGADSPSI
jgi:soluble lytic murein transglycosylase-like protein